MCHVFWKISKLKNNKLFFWTQQLMSSGIPFDGTFCSRKSKRIFFKKFHGNLLFGKRNSVNLEFHRKFGFY